MQCFPIPSGLVSDEVLAANVEVGSWSDKGWGETIIGFAGLGGITGLASWASNELKTPKLGALWFEIIPGTVLVNGDETELPEFCSNCLSKTFWESSDLDEGVPKRLLEQVFVGVGVRGCSCFWIIDPSSLTIGCSTGSLLIKFDDSKLKLLQFLETLWM